VSHVGGRAIVHDRRPDDKQFHAQICCKNCCSAHEHAFTVVCLLS